MTHQTDAAPGAELAPKAPPGASPTPTLTAPAATRLRVLYLMEGFAGGGAERRFVRMASALDRERFALSVGALAPGGPLADAMRATGSPILPFTRRGRFDLGPVARLRRYLRAERIDVVHAMHWLSGVFAVLAATGLSRVAVVGSTVNRVYDTSRAARARLALDRQLWRRLDRMTVNSTALRDYLLARGFPAQKLTTVFNGVELPDASRLTPETRLAARALLEIPPEAPLVGIVARLHPQKDHATFLRAAALVRQQVPGARFAVVGDGPERTALDALAADLGIADAVRFAGHLASGDLALPAFDAAVLCSRHEGMPNALLEAGAWGLPAVATPVPGVGDVLLEGRTGLLAPIGDAPALAERIVGLLRDPARARQMGAAARAHIAAHFTVERMVREYEQVYIAASRQRAE